MRTWRNCTLKPTGGYTRKGAGVMAHRKGICSRGTAAALPAVVLGAWMLAGAVFVSNQVVAQRLRVAALEDRRDCMEAEGADLRADWNHASSAVVIRERAGREIGLQDPADPSLVLARLIPGRPDRPGVLDRILELGGPDALQAAEAKAPQGPAPRAAKPQLPESWSRP